MGPYCWGLEFYKAGRQRSSRPCHGLAMATTTTRGGPRRPAVAAYPFSVAFGCVNSGHHGQPVVLSTARGDPIFS